MGAAPLTASRTVDTARRWVDVFPWLPTIMGPITVESVWGGDVPSAESPEYVTMLSLLAEQAMRHAKAWPLGTIAPCLSQDIPIIDLRLDTRTTNLLRRGRYSTTAALLPASVRDLLAIRTSGTKCVKDILCRILDEQVHSDTPSNPMEMPSRPSAGDEPAAISPHLLTFVTLPGADDPRSALVADYLIRFRECWFRGLDDVQALGLEPMLSRIASASWALRTTCADQRIGHAHGLLDRLHRQPGVVHTLAEESELLCTMLRNGELGQTALRDLSLYALEVIAWAEATTQSPLEVQAWLLVEANMRRRRRRTLDIARVDAVIQRLGLDGRAPIVLEEGGQFCGITRERMRQIQSRVTESLHSARVCGVLWLPALEAINSLHTGGLLTVSELVETCREQGLASGTPTLDALQSASNFVGIDPMPGVGTIIGLESDRFLEIRAAIRDAAARRGLAKVAPIAKLVQPTDPKSAHDLVRAVVDADPDLEWVPVPRGMPWIGCPGTTPRRITLRNVARRMLSVSSPLPVDTLWRGWLRAAKYRPSPTMSLAPTRAFFEFWSEFDLDPSTDTVTSVTPLDFETELSDSAIAMVRVLRGFPQQIGTRRDVLRAFTAAGIPEPTAQATLGFREIVAPYGRAVWGLVGAHPSPTRVAMLEQTVLARSDGSDVTVDASVAGAVTVSFTATKPVFDSGNLMAEWPLRLRECGWFKVTAPTPEGRLHSAVIWLSSGHDLMSDLTSLLSASGVRRGGKVRLSFDLSSNRARMTVDGTTITIPEPRVPRAAGWADASHVASSRVRSC